GQVVLDTIDRQQVAVTISYRSPRLKIDGLWDRNPHVGNNQISLDDLPVVQTPRQKGKDACYNCKNDIDASPPLGRQFGPEASALLILTSFTLTHWTIHQLTLLATLPAETPCK